MSLSKEAIQHIEAQALAAAGKAIRVQGTELALLPDSVSIHSLEQYQPHRNRFRGTLRTSAIPDFVEYVNRHCREATGPACFVNQDEMSAQVIFNLGSIEQAGHGDDTAQLTLKPTAAYASLCAVLGRGMTQQTLAEWLEDWAPHIAAFAHDDPMTIAAAINGVRKMTIKQVSERNSTVGDLSASRSAMDEIEARSQEILPTAFAFSVAPYEGLQVAQIRLRLAVIVSGESMVLKLRWVGEEAQREAFAAEFKQVLAGQLKTVPVTIGSFIVAR